MHTRFPPVDTHTQTTRLTTCHTGGIFPLITTQMYNRLGYGPASSLLGGIGTLLTVVPWILVFYGPRIRARSKFASEIMHATG
jgi:hypothetical protein